MKTKRIKSKKDKLFIVLDLIVLFICVFRCRSFLDNVIGVVNGYNAFNYNIIIIILLTLYMLWVLFLFVVVKNFFIIAIYLAYRIPRKRMIKNNSKYEVIDNITYYRERFKNITPSEISLITDLEVEIKKDFAATMLDLYNNKYIDFESDKLIITNKNVDDLKESSKYCLEIIKNRKYNNNDLSKWKELCINDAINDNLIIENNKDGFNFIKKMSITVRWLLVLFASFIIGACYVATPLFHKTMDDFGKYEEIIKDLKEEEVVELIKSDKEFSDLAYGIYVESIPLMIIGTFIFISIMALISMPIYLKTRKVTYKLVDAKDKYTRTNESKILVEQIAGMKNFIHDFSNLSDREKESVRLWNDFLVYAVVLEENDKIIKDIFNYQSVDINVVDNINKEISLL